MKILLLFLAFCMVGEHYDCRTTAAALNEINKEISLANFTNLGPVSASRFAGAAYWASNFDTSWNEAFEYCYQISAVFLSIQNHIVDEDIRQKLIAEGLMLHTFWTSGRLDATLQYIWAANGQQFLYNNWASLEPAAHCGTNVCVTIRTDGYLNAQYKWYTEMCSSRHKFICVM